MNYEIKPNLEKILKKLKKKNPVAFEAVMDKIGEIVNSDPDHYKPLRHLKDIKRVYVVKSFVLVFSYDKRNKLINFLDYDHHDNIYNKY